MCTAASLTKNPKQATHLNERTHLTRTAVTAFTSAMFRSTSHAIIHGQIPVYSAYQYAKPLRAINEDLYYLYYHPTTPPQELENRITD